MQLRSRLTAHGQRPTGRTRTRSRLGRSRGSGHITRNTQHATRNTQHATRNTQHATRNAQHATRNTQHQVTFDHAVDYLVELAKSDTDIIGLDAVAGLGGGELRQLSTSAKGTCVARTAKADCSFPILTADFGRALKPPPWQPLTAVLRVVSDSCPADDDGGDAGRGASWGGGVEEMVLVDRGGCSFGEKALRAQGAFGPAAAGMLVANYQVWTHALAYTRTSPTATVTPHSTTRGAG
jgi:hypothetical protein